MGKFENLKPILINLINSFQYFQTSVKFCHQDAIWPCITLYVFSFFLNEPVHKLNLNYQSKMLGC